jgi:hypothetical protein
MMGLSYEEEVMAYFERAGCIWVFTRLTEDQQKYVKHIIHEGELCHRTSANTAVRIGLYLRICRLKGV